MLFHISYVIIIILLFSVLLIMLSSFINTISVLWTATLHIYESEKSVINTGCRVIAESDSFGFRSYKVKMCDFKTLQVPVLYCIKRYILNNLHNYQFMMWHNLFYCWLWKWLYALRTLGKVGLGIKRRKAPKTWNCRRNFCVWPTSYVYKLSALSWSSCNYDTPKRLRTRKDVERIIYRTVNVCYDVMVV